MDWTDFYVICERIKWNPSYNVYRLSAMPHFAQKIGWNFRNHSHGLYCTASMGNSGHADLHSRHKFGYGRGSLLLCWCVCPLQPISGFYSRSGRISKSQVLSELEFVLSQKERALHTNSSDTVSQNHINILQQVCDGASRLSTSPIKLPY
jgi:hypothetical protein